MTEVRTALGTADEASEGTATYTPNGLIQALVDGENNKTSYEYDGHDRLAKTFYPMPGKGAGASNASDFEQSIYESLAGGTRTSGLVASFRNRANETTGFGFDALGRRTSKDLPGSEPDATYAYDLLGRLTSATQNGVTVAFTYDALGRQLTQTIPIALIANPVFTSDWDLAGRRTRLTWPVDAAGPTAYYADYDYLITGEVSAIREKGATSGAGVLATYGYDDLGRRTSVTRGNGATTSYGYDAVSRLASMTHDFASTTHDLTLGYTYNPASQIVSATRTNDLYTWTGHGSGTTSSTADGLNRLASHGSVTPTYDARGNLTSDGTYNYTYSSENLLKSFGATGNLAYDPLMRFYENYSSYFVHDSAGAGMLVGEYYNGNVSARTVPGPGVDEPLANISKTGVRSWYHADERGSVIAWSNASGAGSHVLTYDEYGKGAPGNPGRFGYTGQAHLIGDIYDYKARNYNARLGRFLQTDPIGYGDGMNMYAYVKGDPVNLSDPTGTLGECPGTLIVSICGEAADGMARQLIQASEMGGWSPGGQNAAAKIIADYLLGKANLDSVANTLYGTRASEALAASVFGLYSAAGTGGGGGGAQGSWGPEFAAVRDHWSRHGPKLGTRSVAEYIRQAEDNLEQGKKFRFRHEGQQRMAHITRIMQGEYMFTSSNLSSTRIYTHMRVSPGYLRNRGITLPRGF